MREPAYAAWLEAEAAAPLPAPAAAGEEAGAGAAAAALPPRKQAARGRHVDLCGVAVGGELVSTVHVRGEGGARTREYRRLLLEMGKPS